MLRCLLFFKKKRDDADYLSKTGFNDLFGERVTSIPKVAVAEEKVGLQPAIGNDKEDTDQNKQTTVK